MILRDTKKLKRRISFPSTFFSTRTCIANSSIGSMFFMFSPVETPTTFS